MNWLNKKQYNIRVTLSQSPDTERSEVEGTSEGSYTTISEILRRKEKERGSE
jgi:hypothetical protein